MGASGRTTSNNTTAHTVQTPTVPDWISGQYQNYAQGASNFMNSDAMNYTTPASVNQEQAFARARQGTTDPNAAAYQSYTPQQVDVGQLANTDLSPYMNPFQSQVIDQALGDIDRVRMGALAQNSADATKQGAWNGSRHGVVDTGTNDAALRAAGSTAAGLRQSGYQNAQAAAFQDIMNRYNADAFNSQQGLAGRQFNLNAENMRANNLRADTQQMADLGAVQRGISQENNPYIAWLSQLQAYGSLLGQIPTGAFTTQTQDQTGHGTTGSGVGWMTQLGNVLAPLTNAAG